MNKTDALRILAWVANFLAMMGCLGGIGYCIYIEEYVIAAGIAFLGGMAFPTMKKLAKFSNGYNNL